MRLALKQFYQNLNDFRLFVETERERRLNASKESHNTVMEMTKREGGALVRIGDLHTGRRFRQYNRQPVLPTRGHHSFI